MTPNTHTDPSLDTSDHKPKRFADQRGIALQTVIILVVMLAIAGTVAAVLLSRASDVTGELENQDVTTTRVDTAAECERRMGGSTGPQGIWTAGTKKCKWSDPSVGAGFVTEGRCQLVGGTFTEGGTAVDTCEAPKT